MATRQVATKASVCIGDSISIATMKKRNGSNKGDESENECDRASVSERWRAKDDEKERCNRDRGSN